MQPVNVILCGAGRMGRHHLRVVQQDPAFRMVAIVDPALAQGRRSLTQGGASLDGVPVVSDVFEVSAKVHAAIVATPTSTHHDVVVELLERDIAILVEKPLASTPAECAAIARRPGRLAIGHTERFNPAVRAIGPLDGVFHIELVRVGDARRCDVLLELAVHDLDLLERFAGRASLRSASVRSSCADDIIDSADLSLVTETGATATLRAALGDRERRIRIECANGTVELDLLAWTATLNGAPLPVRDEEPLRAQLRAFHAFLEGRPSDVCRIDEASRSVELADAARRSQGPRFAEAVP